VPDDPRLACRVRRVCSHPPRTGPCALLVRALRLARSAQARTHGRAEAARRDHDDALGHDAGREDGRAQTRQAEGGRAYGGKPPAKERPNLWGGYPPEVYLRSTLACLLVFMLHF